MVCLPATVLRCFFSFFCIQIWNIERSCDSDLNSDCLLWLCDYGAPRAKLSRLMDASGLCFFLLWVNPSEVDVLKENQFNLIDGIAHFPRPNKYVCMWIDSIERQCQLKQPITVSSAIPVKGFGSELQIINTYSNGRIASNPSIHLTPIGSLLRSTSPRRFLGFIPVLRF